MKLEKGKSRFCAQAKFGNDWSGMKVIFVAFSSGSVVRSSFPLYFYWAACAPSHKMGFRSSVSKSGLPGEGRHEGLVPRNDVLTNGFI